MCHNNTLFTLNHIAEVSGKGQKHCPFSASVFMLATLHMAQHQTRVLHLTNIKQLGVRGAIVFDMKVLCKTHPWRSALLYHRSSPIAKSHSE